MHLDRKVKVPRLRVGEESGQPCDIHRGFGNPGKTREGQQLVDVAAEPRGERG